MNDEIIDIISMAALKHRDSGEVSTMREARLIITALETNGYSIVKNCSIPDVGGSFLYELKTIAYGKGSSSERLEEIKKKLSSK